MAAKTLAKILVAEDERSIARALQLKLQKSGFDAQTVGTGHDAIKQLEAKHYDLLLLDLIMPDLDGFGVLKEIQKKDLKVKVIVTSNLSQEEDVIKAKALGAVDYFVKSNMTLVKLIEVIKSHLA